MYKYTTKKRNMWGRGEGILVSGAMNKINKLDKTIT